MSWKDIFNGIGEMLDEGLDEAEKAERREKKTRKGSYQFSAGGTNIQQASIGNGSVTINGKTYKGNKVRVNGNKVYVDGKRVDHGEVTDGILEVKVTGDLVSLEADGSVTCDNVNGTAQAGGSIKCGDVGGNVQAGGSVKCGEVSGSVMAGGSVRGV